MTVTRIMNATELTERVNDLDRRLRHAEAAVLKPITDKTRELADAVFDKVQADSVEFLCDATGKVWLNVNGECIFRIGKAKYISIETPLHGFDVVRDPKDAVASQLSE